MMIAIIFFLFAAILGTLFVYFLKLNLFLEEKLAWGIVLGSISLTFLSFIFSFLFGFNKTVIILSFIPAILFLVILFLKNHQYLFQEIIGDIKIFKERINNKKLFQFLFILFFAILLFGSLWPKVLYQNEQGIFTIGTNGVWGDWAAHISYISHFVFNDKISLEHPLFLGQKFSYTFMVDFLSSLLIKTGENLISAMIIPGFVFSIAFVVLLYYFIFRLTDKENVSSLAIYLYIFGGGLGFIYFLQNIQGLSVPEIMSFFRNSPLEYTNILEQNIHWTSFLNSLFLPQRALTMGMPLGILILTLILIALKKGKDNKLFLFAGIAAALLPLIHIHSLIAVSIVVLFLILSSSGKDIKVIAKRLSVFYAPIVILGLVQIFALFNLGAENLKFNLGWMAGNENWLIFYLKNLGLFFIFLPLVFFTIKKELRLFYLSFFTLFIVSNIFLFQPFDFDNIKIMTYWFLMTAIIFSVFLINLWKKNILGKIATTMIIFFAIFSSSLDLIHLYFRPGYLLFSKEDIAIAEMIRERTPENSVFLTSDAHNHFVPTLTGRQILMGYSGWLWSYGINYLPRYNDVLIMFGGGEKAKELFEKYKINYVTIGLSEKYNFKANELFFEENYPLIASTGNIKVYKIK